MAGDGVTVRPKVSRRGLFAMTLAGAAGSAGLGVIAPAASSSSEEGDSVAGVIERVIDDSRIAVRAGSPPRVIDVVLAPGASVYRDGPSSLMSFVVGDRITARGQQSGTGAWIALEVQALYELSEAVVTGRRAGVVDTNAGRLIVDAKTQARDFTDHRALGATPPEGLSPGDTIVALVRDDTRTGQRLARVIASDAQAQHRS